MAELAELDAEVRHNLDRLVQAGVQAITAATGRVSAEVRETHIPAEAPVGDTGTLSSPSSWHERVEDPLTRVVFPGEDAFYAHIVSGGRGAVRPMARRALTVGDVVRMSAGPQSPNPFEERAVRAAEGRVDELLADALSEAGV